MCILRAPRLTYSFSQYLQLKYFWPLHSHWSRLCLAALEKLECSLRRSEHSKHSWRPAAEGALGKRARRGRGDGARLSLLLRSPATPRPSGSSRVRDPAGSEASAERPPRASGGERGEARGDDGGRRRSATGERGQEEEEEERDRARGLGAGKRWVPNWENPRGESQHGFPLLLSQPGLGTAFTLYLAGWRTTPNLPSRLGSGWPGGTERVKCCRIHDRKRKSSILAKASPRHTRIPAPNGR
ncbi:hypothetical protein EYF80_038928 [Liparis tanakae]|uniref:Uncharacterized protein n=1 Tax=Liparis tanakae TaxID=230148 RepID=A0A4Z2GCJ4_9TELE|nr:hypothetical protein EYF80_038928 [Liparis tanakae]